MINQDNTITIQIMNFFDSHDVVEKQNLRIDGIIIFGETPQFGFDKWKYDNAGFPLTLSQVEDLIKELQKRLDILKATTNDETKEQA